MQPGQRFSAIVLVSALAAACGGSEGASAKAVSVPSRSGDVWELDAPDDRATAPIALAAFVSGAHVILVDGEEAYAGTGTLAETGAALVKEGDALSLRLADGTTARLRRQSPHAEAAR